jgi:hypothetical protein
MNQKPKLPIPAGPRNRHSSDHCQEYIAAGFLNFGLASHFVLRPLSRSRVLKREQPRGKKMIPAHCRKCYFYKPERFWRPNQSDSPPALEGEQKS